MRRFAVMIYTFGDDIQPKGLMIYTFGDDIQPKGLMIYACGDDIQPQGLMIYTFVDDIQPKGLMIYNLWLISQNQNKIKAKALYIINFAEIAYHPSENEYISLSGEYIIKSQRNTPSVMIYIQ